MAATTRSASRRSSPPSGPVRRTPTTGVARRSRPSRFRRHDQAGHRHAVAQRHVGVVEHDRAQHPLEGRAAAGQGHEVLVARLRARVVDVGRHGVAEAQLGRAGRQEPLQHVGVPVAEEVAEAGEQGVGVADLRRALAVPLEGGVGVRRGRVASRSRIVTWCPDARQRQRRSPARRRRLRSRPHAPLVAPSQKLDRSVKPTGRARRLRPPGPPCAGGRLPMLAGPQVRVRGSAGRVAGSGSAGSALLVHRVPRAVANARPAPKSACRVRRPGCWVGLRRLRPPGPPRARRAVANARPVPKSACRVRHAGAWPFGSGGSRGASVPAPLALRRGACCEAQRKESFGAPATPLMIE